jgi:regulator of protease activity HflC (stomatin/prohibitin superfamily)
MEVRTQKYQAEADSASSDLQKVQTTVALNFHLDPTKVGDLYKNIGKDFEERIVVPSIQEGVKASTAKFTAEELITKREEVKDKIEEHLKNRLETYNIILETISITDFQFTEVFDTAIEAKVKAEQDALASKNKLEQIKYEAQQQIESAKGQAESIRIINEELERSQKYLTLKTIEKWNGILPYVVGSSTPFIDISQFITG